MPPIRKLRPEVPAELVAVLDGMLAKRPDDRFATPAEVVAAIAPFAKGCDLLRLLQGVEEPVKPAKRDISLTGTPACVFCGRRHRSEPAGKGLLRQRGALGRETKQVPSRFGRGLG